jgi:hypothetical protein
VGPKKVATKNNKKKDPPAAARQRTNPPAAAAATNPTPAAATTTPPPSPSSNASSNANNQQQNIPQPVINLTSPTHQLRTMHGGNPITSPISSINTNGLYQDATKDTSKMEHLQLKSFTSITDMVNQLINLTNNH